MTPDKSKNADLTKEKEYIVSDGRTQKISPFDWVVCAYGCLQVVSTDLANTIDVIYNEELMTISLDYVEHVFRRVP